MKYFKKLLYIILVLFVCVFIGCEKEDDPTVTPDVPVDTPTADAPTNGYTPENGEIVVSCKEANQIGWSLNIGSSTSEVYQITGKITIINNSIYGNLFISDDSGEEFYIYGLYQNGVRYDSLSEQPVEGDEIVVTGNIFRYNDSTIEFKSAELKYIKRQEIIDESDGINFIMINDTHGAFIDDETPGIGRVSGLIDELSAAKGDYIKIANGDIFQGSYVSNVMSGRPLVDALNAMNFDCFVIGNHEFDWGLDEIAKYKDGNLENGEAEFPFLGANIIDKKTNEIVSWINPYVIKKYGNLNVGIIGVIGHEQESSILAENVKDYDFVYPIELIRKYAEELRTEKDCDIVVTAIHDFDENLNYAISKLEGDARIDGIFCAHTHQKVSDYIVRRDGKSIFVLQCNDKNKNVAEAIITLENDEYKSFTSRHYNPSSYDIDDDIMKIINKYQKEINEGNRNLGDLPYDLSKSELGLIATNAMKDEYNTDIAIINTGGIRATINGDCVYVKDVFNVFPFDNEIFLIELEGREVISLYQSNRSYLYFNEDFNINNINNNIVYKIAVIDYVFTSPYYDEFKDEEYTDTDVILRDLLVTYIDNMYQ